MYEQNQAIPQEWYFPSFGNDRRLSRGRCWDLRGSVSESSHWDSMAGWYWEINDAELTYIFKFPEAILGIVELYVVLTLVSGPFSGELYVKGVGVSSTVRL